MGKPRADAMRSIVGQSHWKGIAEILGPFFPKTRLRQAFL
jgi:hypothetical protein